MAYESKVTNKYFGTTFAGAGKASVEDTAVSGLIKSLKTVQPQLEKLGQEYISEKEKLAATEINKLSLQGRSPQEIKSIIDSGKNEALSSMYADATNNLWLGKLQAAKDIQTAQENMANYNPDEQTMDEFLSDNINSDFTNSDKYYASGYAAEFNEKKAVMLSEDADFRFKQTSQKRTQELASYIATHDASTKLEDGTSVTFYDRIDKQRYSKKQINDATLLYAKGIAATATDVMEIDKALEFLYTDRGTGKQGMKLGSLVSAKNLEALELVDVLNRKRVNLSNQKRLEEQYRTAKVVNDSFLMAAKGDFNDKQAYKNYLLDNNVYSQEAMDTFDRINSSNTYYATTVEVDNFKYAISEGAFQNKTYNTVINEALSRGIRVDNSFHVLWERASKGEEPVYITNNTMAREIDTVSKTIAMAGMDGQFNPSIKARVDRFLQREMNVWYYNQDAAPTAIQIEDYIRNVLEPRAAKLMQEGSFGAQESEAYSPLSPKQQKEIEGQTQLGIDTTRNLEEVQTFREKYRKGEKAPTSAESVRTGAAEAIKTSETNKMIDDFMEGIKTSDDIAFELPVFDKTDININRLFNPEQGFQEQEVYPAVIKAFSDLTGVTNQKQFDDLFTSFSAEGIDRVGEFVTTLSEKLGIPPKLVEDSLDYFGENLANIANEERMKKYRGEK
jgi:hypothetical protein